jgi:DNA modification methylase
VSVETVISDPDFTLIHGGALEALRTLPDECAQTTVTSPPYWGLRDYGTGSWEGGDPGCDHQVREDARAESSTLVGGKKTTGHQREGHKGACPRCGARRVDAQLGLEPTIEGYIDALVGVFRELRRVLRRDGTVWLVLGDSYTSGGRDWREDDEGGPGGRGMARGLRPRTPTGLKAKDLAMVPARVALALQEDGWWLRQDVIEEVELYCPCGCGYLLEERVWRWAQDRDLIWHKPNAMPESVTDRPSSCHEHVFLLAREARYYYDQDAVREPYRYDGRRVTHVEARDGSIQHRSGERWPGLKPRTSGNLKRKIPQDAGTPDDRHGEVGRSIPWQEDGTGRNSRSVWQIPTQPFPGAHFAVFPEELVRRCILAGSPVGATVLDPFCGTGTVPLVARKHERRCIGVELSTEFVEMIADRTGQLSLLAQGAP